MILRLFLVVLERPFLLSLVGRLGSLADVLPGVRHLVPRRFRLSGLPIRRGARLRSPETDPQIWIFTGCVMDAWFQPVHRATMSVLRTLNRNIGVPAGRGLCCGAIHLHSGGDIAARRRAHKVIDSMPGDAPIVVDAAGCGAMLKEYGDLLGTSRARIFSQRVVDIHEWIADHIVELTSMSAGVSSPNVAMEPVVVQEPCHLRHVQGVSVADVLEHFVPVRRLDDDNLCCGAGGAYSLVQPRLAQRIRHLKSESIDRAKAGRPLRVVTANPGCHMHLAAASLEMVSSIEVIAEAMGLDTKKGT